MKVITVGNVKGGVGKSTIACNLAVEATKAGKKVLLIDSDTQQSSVDFRATRAEKGLPEFQAVSITKNTIHKDVGSFKDFDFIFIDAGGRDTAVFRSAILASDLFLIPVLPSQYDIWATAGTVETLEEAKSFKEVNACFVINQVIPNTTVAKEAFQALEDFKIPILNTKIHARVAFKQSISEGKGVTEYEAAGKNGKASKELTALFQEVLKCL
jgi:chromosome partitioning protein